MATLHARTHAPPRTAPRDAPAEPPEEVLSGEERRRLPFRKWASEPETLLQAAGAPADPGLVGRLVFARDLRSAGRLRDDA
jgi:hypothetical protein